MADIQQGCGRAMSTASNFSSLLKAYANRPTSTTPGQCRAASTGGCDCSVLGTLRCVACDSTSGPSHCHEPTHGC